MDKNKLTPIEAETKGGENSPKKLVAKHRKKIAIILGIALAALACILDRCNCGNCETGKSNLHATNDQNEKQKSKDMSDVVENNPDNQKTPSKKSTCPSAKSYSKDWESSSKDGGRIDILTGYKPSGCLPKTDIFGGVKATKILEAELHVDWHDKRDNTNRSNDFLKGTLYRNPETCDDFWIIGDYLHCRIVLATRLRNGVLLIGSHGSDPDLPWESTLVENKGDCDPKFIQPNRWLKFKSK
jgi:hypothetical protein